MKRALLVTLALSAACICLAGTAGPRQTIKLDGEGWMLWIDKSADWQNDRLYLPGEFDLAKLPVNPPTGGWSVLEDKLEAIPVSVPGTVELYTTKSANPRPEDSMGVSWWYRTLNIPASQRGKHFILRFESVRARAEVYLDGKLVAYDIVGESPFESDITDAVVPGKEQLLAVRVTNFGGNFHWQDFNPVKWGEYRMAPGRGFSGIIGRVALECVPDVYIDDIYMQNTALPTKVNAIVTIKNLSGKDTRRSMAVSVSPKHGDLEKPLVIKLKGVEIPADGKVIEIPVDNPEARLWDIGTPELYDCFVALKSGSRELDSSVRTFGFRSFTLDGIGKDAMPRFNGKRVMLRSAISWGYFPATGLQATPDMAIRQVCTAKELGYNMLNFHRSIGSPVVLEAADSIGLYYYEEPGAIHSADHDPFLRALVNEKLHRMVKRDRSHPSLLMYNLINEFGGALSKDTALVSKRMKDMVAAHALDPSRPMTFTSGWASKESAEEDSKSHMRPFDNTLYRKGWFDNHRAGGPATYEESYYSSPEKNIMYTDNRTEIFMRGEEGAISTPPRISLIHDELQKTGMPGWDGRFWEKQYASFNAFFEEKGLAEEYGDLDGLCRAMGNVQFEHQGRRIQGMRMQDIGDIYVTNGWDSMPFDNHSGVVDIYRNPKGDVEIMQYYTQPFYVAVCPRKQVLSFPAEVGVDFYAVNEAGQALDGTLVIDAVSPDGVRKTVGRRPVSVSGGDRFGELLAENVSIGLDGAPGMYTIEARLEDKNGNVAAQGADKVLTISWSASDLNGSGAIYGSADSPVCAFYKSATGKELPQYSPETGKLDWIVVTRNSLDAPEPIPDDAFLDKNGRSTLHLSWFSDNDIKNLVATTTDTNINRSFVEGAQPDASLPANQEFSALWEGELMPKESGLYLIGVESTAGIRLSVNGVSLLDEYWNAKHIEESRPVMMEAGKPVKVSLGYYQHRNSGSVRIKWSRPSGTTVNPEEIFDRARRKGTEIIILDCAETWMSAVAKATGTVYDGFYNVGKDWIGGIHFSKNHPLLDGLPSGTSLDWPYQAVVRDGNNRFGFEYHGEDMVIGSYRSWPFHLGTAVGVVPCGRGRIIFSSLDISGQMLNPSGTAEVARKLFCNYVKYHKQ